MAEEADDEVVVSPSTEPVEEKSTDVDLPHGDSLQPNESIAISCASPTRFIIVAGAAESGKTTLVGSIFERFRLGVFGGYRFAGSQTLRGFERICHPGRVASGNTIPQTERTKLPLGRQLLHLRFRKLDGSLPCQDLLISDLSGEEFDNAKDFGSDARNLSIVRSAHRLLRERRADGR